jgi:hypothetical protein
MKTIHRAVGRAVVLAVVGLLSACGMSPKAEAPTSEAAPAAGMPGTAQAAEEEGAGEPTTLADAEALLEKARADLNRLALNEPMAPPAAAGAAAPSVQVAPAPSPAPPRDEARRAEKSSSASADAAPPAPAKEANACETACKAFSSLTRASDAVCRLDTDGGKRCERARQIREDASHRVASCGCAK